MRAIFIARWTAWLGREYVGARKHRVRRLLDQLDLPVGERNSQTLEHLARRMHGDAPGKFLFNDGAIYDITTLSPGRITVTVACGATVATAALNISPACTPSTNGLCA